MKRFLNSNKIINGFYLLIHGCFLLSFLLVQGCNDAKAISIDASSSAIGALLSDGNFGVFGNFGDSGGTSPAATSPVTVSLTGYVDVTATDLNLTLSDSTDSTTQTLALSANGSYSFSTELTSGDSYSISLGAYTQGQSCSISANGSGTAGTTGTATIVCERQLAIAAGWKTSSGTPVLKLFGVNHSASPYLVTKNLSITVGGAPGSVDPELVWNGTNYLLIWKSADTTIKGQFYDITLTAVAPAFTIYTGAGVTIGKVSAAYNPSGEFAVVWTESASIRAAKYQRISASTGALVGTATTIASSTSTNYFNADVALSGSTYYTAFRQRTSGGANLLTAFSFSNGSASSVKTYTASNGTDSLALDYPSLLVQGSNTWLFFSQTETDGSGNVSASSLKISKNFQTSPGNLRTETNPYGCDPLNSSGDQYMLPSAAIANSTNLLVSYDLFCGDMGVYNEVSDLPVTITSGAAGIPTDYSSAQITTGATMGSSITCRTNSCFISVGDESADYLYLFDPDPTTGGDNGTLNLYLDVVNGIESPVTVIQ
ncbi:hypothetical protein [Leptospira licerasiae]|uniref:Lipoprotein n=1 Tax=Leptospira licerasiae str. MMD4847 TaxID=1049971 RepID=A0ABN0HDB6_9LEPT|nr:hypothetical protein [Leptospira licerasiae]EIE03177.1 hypothetical protein LEP1GSC185_0914 [Leptospira licerasiae serovar Varillal str. VAR 010]EJZ43337.1 putative lipoprotein [Leptospira licerasiae str. MMD4847]